MAAASSHERLPSLQKIAPLDLRISPSLGLDSSPVESEFGATPIDTSFGERVELPQGDRLGVPSQQRRRSGTATQADHLREGKMDKYSRQAGDHTYDSDADADDEFERSVVGVASPTVPTHFDDGESDHPSDSEEEHDSVDGEDTPTTQGWADRDGRSPTGNITQWTEDQVGDYVASLSPALKQYSQAFAEEGVNGEALIALHHDELRELGVTSVGHRLTILKAVYEQKLRSGVKVQEDDYVPLSAEGDKGDLSATQDDIARVIESIRLRDQRIIAAEAELRVLKNDLDRISDENRKLREETLPIMRLMKDQRTPLPDPAGGTIPSPRDAEPSKVSENLAPVKESKGSSLSRKFSTKKLFLGGAPKQPSPTHPPPSYTPQPREVRDDSGTHLEASAAALAASSHLTASMTAQTSPGIQSQQLSPTSPAYSNQPSSAGSYHGPNSAAARSFPRGHNDRPPYHQDPDTGTHWSQASTVVDNRDRRRQQAPTPSPREQRDDRDTDTPGSAPLPGSSSQSTRGGGDRSARVFSFVYVKPPWTRTDTFPYYRDNPQVEIFKSFRVSIEDPCEVVLPVVSPLSSPLPHHLPHLHNLQGSQTLQHPRRLAAVRPLHRARRPGAVPGLEGKAAAPVQAAG